MTISGIAVIAIPFFRGRKSRTKHCWVFRLDQSSSGNVMSYVVPNRSIILTLFEMVSGIMYLLMAFFSFQRFRSPTNTARCFNMIWYGVSWLPTYLGIWMSGWGLLYASYGRDVSHCFLSPRLYNIAWMGWSLVVITVTTIWATINYHEALILCGHLNQLAKLLRKTELAWDIDTDSLRQFNLSVIGSKNSETLQSLARVLSTLRYWAFCWMCFGFVIAVFYIVLVRRILKTIGKILTFCETRALYCANVPIASVTLNTTAKNVSKKTTINLTEIRQEFRFLALYNGIICLVLVSELAVAVYQFHATYHVQDPRWESLSAILCMVPTAIMSPALLFQCWRIFTERSNTDDSDFDHSTNSTQKDPQPIFQENLLKSYLGNPLDDPDYFNPENFPGIIDCYDNRLSKSDCTPLSDMKIIPPSEKLEFRITREVATTEAWRMKIQSWGVGYCVGCFLWG